MFSLFPNRAILVFSLAWVHLAHDYAEDREERPFRVSECFDDLFELLLHEKVGGSFWGQCHSSWIYDWRLLLRGEEIEQIV